MKRGILLLVFIVISQIVSVNALDINLAKSSYLPGETFQAEISGEFSKPLTASNIFFLNEQGKEIALAFYLIEIVKSKDYYVYVDLPLQSGKYSIAIKNALYYENGTLKGTEKKINFQVNESIALTYKDVISLISNQFSSLSVQDNALALSALAYDSVLAAKAKDALMAKSRNSECWPSTTCNVKDTALAVMALSKLSTTTNSWLIDARNDLELGLWNLQANSNSQQECGLSINNNTERKV